MSITDDFTVFWQHYPRHIGKLAAQKAYMKARKIASAAELLDGIARYIAAKPVYADYCHAQTFLNQGRWLDEPDTPVGRPDCPHHPRCLAPGRWQCQNKTKLEVAKKSGAA